MHVQSCCFTYRTYCFFWRSRCRPRRWILKSLMDPFAQLFQLDKGNARSLHVVFKVLCVVFFPKCSAGPNIIVGKCCIRLHTTANTDANNSQSFWLNNVWNCCVRLQVATSVTRLKLCASIPNNNQAHATQGEQADETCNIQQCLANNIASVCTVLDKCPFLEAKEK